MFQNKKVNLFYSLSVILFATLITVAIIYAWTEPTSAPPAGNVSAPLNVSTTTQYKGGALGIGGVFQSNSLAIFNATTTTFSGNVGIGTTTPAQKLTVAGTIESTSGGFKFPDGSMQDKAVSGTAIVAAGENIIFSTRDYTAYPDSYTKQFSTKQFVSGTVRIRYVLSAPSFGYGYARIYKNGIAVGPEHSVYSGSAGFADDISVSINDTIEVWTRRSGGWVTISDFRILVQ